MANKGKQGKQAEIKVDPKPAKMKLKRKPCKSPRGLKLEKAADKLLVVVDKPFKRHRNDYNEHMAKVRRLASLVQRVR